MQSGGNRNLSPEISDTKSFGVVFTPTFIDGFSATVDYFDIDVKNYISTIGAPTILSGCYNRRRARAAADRLLLPARPSFGIRHHHRRRFCPEPWTSTCRS